MGANVLHENAELQAQLLLSDILGHSSRIWDHLIRWADSENKQKAVLSQKKHMLEKYVAWKRLISQQEYRPHCRLPKKALLLDNFFAALQIFRRARR